MPGVLLWGVKLPANGLEEGVGKREELRVTSWCGGWTAGNPATETPGEKPVCRRSVCSFDAPANGLCSPTAPSKSRLCDFLAGWPSPGLTSCHCRMAFVSRNCWLRWMSCDVTSSREAWHGDALPTVGRRLIPTLHAAGRTGTDASPKRTHKRRHEDVRHPSSSGKRK